MARVFVIHHQHRFDRQQGKRVPRLDLSPAEDFGELVYLLGDDATAQDPGDVIRQLMLGLADFSDQDHLLLVGHPAFIGWATAIAASYNDGKISLLIYQRDHRYISVDSRLPNS